jgi:hypothetical protein
MTYHRSRSLFRPGSRALPAFSRIGGAADQESLRSTNRIGPIMRIHPAGRIARRAALAAVFLLAGILPSLSQAVTLFTSGGAEVRGFLARSSTSVFAAAYGGGLYQSADAGATWSRVSLTTNNERYLTSIAGTAATYILVGGEEGLLRSTTGAANSFTKILAEPITAIAVAPNGTTAIAAIKGMGIVRSVDSGVTWTLATNTGFDSTDMTAVAFDPSNGNIAYAAAKPDGLGARGGVFRSNDAGVTWASHMAAALTDKNITSLAVDSAGTVYAGVLNGGGVGDVYFRTQAGPTWTGTGVFFGVVSLHRDANTGTTMWGGSRGLGLLNGSSTTWAYTFSQNGQPNLLYTGITAVTTLPGSTVALKAVKGAGVWRSAAGPNPRTWARVPFPGADRVLSASAVGGAPNSMLIGLLAGGVWRSDTAGNAASTFNPPTVNGLVQADFAFAAGATAVNPFVSIWDLAASTTNGNTIYAAAGGVGMFYGNDNPGLFRFNGTSWGGVGNNAPTGAPWNGTNEAGIALNIQQVYGVKLNIGNDAIAYTSYLTPGGVFSRSGASWTQVVPPGVTPQVRNIAMSASSSKYLAMPFDDKPAYTTNLGTNFTQVAISQTGFERIRFFSASENPINTAQWVGGTNKGVFYSSDFGATWTRVTMAGVFLQHPVPAVAFHPSSQRAFAGDFDGNRYCSANGGVTWVLLAGKLNSGITSIRNINGTLYYTTDGAGLWREDSTC